MRNKKAMSEIVTTVIMVVLALVAVAVIWGIINNLISEKGAQISVGQKCLAVTLNVEGVSGCTADRCTVMVKRAAGGEAFTGVKIVLKSPTEASKVIDIPGNIEELATVSLDAAVIAEDAFDASTANKVEVTAYFTDDSGVPQNCPSTEPYTFV